MDAPQTCDNLFVHGLLRYIWKGYDILQSCNLHEAPLQLPRCVSTFVS